MAGSYGNDIAQIFVRLWRNRGASHIARSVYKNLCRDSKIDDRSRCGTKVNDSCVWYFGAWWVAVAELHWPQDTCHPSLQRRMSEGRGAAIRPVRQIPSARLAGQSRPQPSVDCVAASLPCWPIAWSCGTHARYIGGTGMHGGAGSSAALLPCRKRVNFGR
jgi:hypothetical protein